MAVTPGTRLGAYAVVSELGAGGMGEVDLAVDTRLDRRVAVKALPDHLTTDPDRLARFEREAKVMASLNHPNVGTSETGQSEIVVQPFPALAAKYVISTGGGIMPRWSGDSRQLFYVANRENTSVMAVSLTTTPSFSASRATLLFAGPYDADYDVTADGTRFLMVRRADRGPDPTELRVIVNWTRALTAGR